MQLTTANSTSDGSIGKELRHSCEAGRGGSRVAPGGTIQALDHDFAEPIRWRRAAGRKSTERIETNRCVNWPPLLPRRFESCVIMCWPHSATGPYQRATGCPDWCMQVRIPGDAGPGNCSRAEAGALSCSDDLKCLPLWVVPFRLVTVCVTWIVVCCRTFVVVPVGGCGGFGGCRGAGGCRRRAEGRRGSGGVVNERRSGWQRGCGRKREVAGGERAALGRTGAGAAAGVRPFVRAGPAIVARRRRGRSE